MMLSYRAWKLFLLLFIGCGSDGGEFVSPTEIKFVPYIGGIWKFEDGQRYYLKSVNNIDGARWEIG